MDLDAAAPDLAELIERAIALTAGDRATIATDPLGRIVYWCDNAEALYGWTRGEVLGRNIVDVTPSDQTRAEAAAIMMTLRSGEMWRGSFNVRKRDGTVFAAEVVDTPVFNRYGKLVGIIGSSTPAD